MIVIRALIFETSVYTALFTRRPTVSENLIYGHRNSACNPAARFNAEYRVNIPVKIETYLLDTRQAYETKNKDFYPCMHIIIRQVLLTWIRLANQSLQPLKSLKIFYQKLKKRKPQESSVPGSNTVPATVQTGDMPTYRFSVVPAWLLIMSTVWYSRGQTVVQHGCLVRLSGVTEKRYTLQWVDHYQY